MASSVHGRVQRRQQRRWAAQEQEAHAAQTQQHAGYPATPVAPPAAAPPAAAPASPLDAAAQLELLAKLGELKQAGILTEQEFQAKKAEILNG